MVISKHYEYQSYQHPFFLLQEFIHHNQPGVTDLRPLQGTRLFLGLEFLLQCLYLILDPFEAMFDCGPDRP